MLIENEVRKRKGFRGSFLSVDRTWFYLEVSSYIRSPLNKEVIGLVATFNSLNDLLGKSGVSINAKVQQGGAPPGLQTMGLQSMGQGRPKTGGPLETRKRFKTVEI